jgi:hypothetical protein
MRRAARWTLPIAVLILGRISTQAVQAPDPVIINATRLFGQPLRSERANPSERGGPVFRLNDTWIIWLVEDGEGRLIEANVGPKSYYVYDFPSAPQPPIPEFLSQSEFDQAIQTISKLKEVGSLRVPHTHSIPSYMGPLSTDIFDKASVERIHSKVDDDQIVRFTIRFLRDISTSPEQLSKAGGPSMVCAGDRWYYLPPAPTKKITLGTWQTLRVTGPAVRGGIGCARTTTVRDREGFTVEQPLVETIEISDPYKVRELSGRVTIDGENPIEEASVEFLLIGTRKMLRTKTDKDGSFSITGAAEGRYKVKVTKNGFDEIFGTVIVDKHAKSTSGLSFNLPLGA